MARRPLPPLQPGWLVVEGLPLYHRWCDEAGPDAPALVHVHGFGISGTYLEPTAARLCGRYRNYVPDLPGMGRSMRPSTFHDLPGLARSVIAYCDAVGVERATFVGNSLGCPIICELADSFPERVDRAVFVSPAGGPNNQPLVKAIGQMAVDGLREPPSMVPIAVRDYLNFGLIQGLRLFRAMTRFPTIERFVHLPIPILVVAGWKDPLVKIQRVEVLEPLPDLAAVAVPGAHALNFSDPVLISALVDAFLQDEPLHRSEGPLREVLVLREIHPAGAAG